MIRAEVIPNDVLLTIAGSIGNCCVVKGLEKANINQAIVKIRPKEDIDSDYLSIFLNSKYGKFQTQRLANGAVQLNVNFSEVGDIRVIIPSLEIQRELVAEIEIARESRKQKLAEADALLSSLDDYLLEQLGLTTPEKSDRLTFAVRSEQLRNNRWDVKAYTIEGNAPFRSHYPNIAIHNFVSRIQEKIDSDQIDREDFITLSLDGTIKPKRIMEWREIREDESLFKSQMFIAREGQLIFSKIDFRNGAIAVVNQNKVAVTAEFPIYKLDEKQINSDFFVLVLRSSLFLTWVNNLSSGHTGRKRVNPSQFESFEIPLPSIAIQEKIAQEVQTRRELARKLRSEAETQWEAAKLRFETRLLEG